MIPYVALSFDHYQSGVSLTPCVALSFDRYQSGVSLISYVELSPTASRLKSYMDDSVDPCNNFYEYACGGWFKSQVLDADDVKIDVASTISDSNRIKIRSEYCL